MTLSIAFLLQSTAISGTARTVLAFADALAARGHRVRIVTAETPATWRSSQAEWVLLDDLRRYDPSGDDFVVTWSADGDVGAPRILPLPTLTTFAHIVDDDVYRAQTPRENDPLRLLMAGPSQVERKGIDDGYGAVAHARWFHQKLDLVRVSPWAPSREEPLDSVQEFHVALTAAEMTRLMHSCDAVLVPSHADDGMSLVAAEAMAAGLPVVLTATAAHLSIAEPPDFAAFAPPDNAVDLGEALITVLSDAELRARLRVRGRDVSAQWRAPRVGERLETFLAGRAGARP